MSEDTRVQGKPRKIFLVNFDWRDIFRTSFVEVEEKLKRDRLEPGYNSFFFFSWAHTTYGVQGEKYSTVHKNTYYLEVLRPLLDLYAIIAIPFSAYRNKQRPDIWTTYDFGMVPALWVCKHLFGGRLVMVLNNQPRIYSQTRKFGTIKGYYSWLMERVGIRLVDHMFTINTTMKQYIMSLGCSEKNITVFSMDTINRERHMIDESKAGRIRERYSIAPDSKILLTVARLEAEKNYPRLLQLFAGLGSEYTLISLGRGSMLTELQELAKKLNIADRVFFAGYVHRDDIWNYYRDADAFVLISTAEALGVVLWEAMYLDVPVVSSDVEGILETVGDDAVRARVWREEDGQQGFTERIRFCTAESEERNAMLARAKAFVEQQIENQVTINTLPIWE